MISSTNINCSATTGCAERLSGEIIRRARGMTPTGMARITNMVNTRSPVWCCRVEIQKCCIALKVNSPAFTFIFSEQNPEIAGAVFASAFSF